MRFSVYFFVASFVFSFPIFASAASVLDYGARCDGSTNDTNAFKNALASNSVVDVPAGKTCMVRDLVVGSGKTLQGAGATSILKLPSGSTYMQRVVEVKGSNIKILNLVIDGNKQAHTHLLDVGARCGRPDCTPPHGVDQNGGMHALAIEDNSGPVEVRDVYLRNAWTDGLTTRPGVHDLLIANVTADGNRRQGWSSRSLRNAVVRDSVFKNTKGRLPQAGIDIEPLVDTENVIGLRFTNNIVSGNFNPLVFDINGGVVEDIIIENSSFFDNERDHPEIDMNFVGGFQDGRSQPTTFRNITIRNNKLEDVVRFSAETPGSATFSNILIENNKTGGNYIPDGHSGTGITERNNNNPNAGHKGTPGAWGGSSVTPDNCVLYGSGSTPASSGPHLYGASWDLFDSQKRLLLNFKCVPFGHPTIFTVGRDVATQLIWPQTYAYTNGTWLPYTLQGPRSESAPEWIVAKGSVQMAVPPNTTSQNPFYAVGYVCTQVGSAWKCGCRGASCATPYWQLQGYVQ